MHLLLLKPHAVKNTYKNAFIMYYHTILIGMYAFAISYAISMHIGSIEEITLQKFNEGEEANQQQIPQAAAPEEEEQNPEELPLCSGACLSERKWGGGQGTLEALLGAAPRLRELWLEESLASPRPFLR